MKTPNSETQILQALTDYFHAISNHDLSKIELSLQQLETLEESISPHIHPQLRHYLQRKSYRKALQWIQAIHSHTS
jgi:hypothetical protein